MSKILDNGVVRDMTEAELEQLTKDAAAAEAQQQAAADAAAARVSALAKLAALGLTEAEINAIIGGA